MRKTVFALAVGLDADASSVFHSRRHRLRRIRPIHKSRPIENDEDDVGLVVDDVVVVVSLVVRTSKCFPIRLLMVVVVTMVL